MSTKSIALTAEQKTHTLSAKKKKSKKLFRYVLAQPFPRYWPQIDEHQTTALLEIMCKYHVEHPEWFSGKKLTNTDTKSIHCGLQASIRKLQMGHIKLLILSADLKPRYVANQIIVQALANNANIHILCIANMVNFTQILLNFPCYAFVVDHKNWPQMLELNSFAAKIVDDNHPLPPLIKEQFAKRKDASHSSNTPMDVDEQCQRQKETIQSKHLVNYSDVKHLHLRRDANQRAFIPKNGINLTPIALEIESLNKIKSDFISLETYNNEASASTSFKPTKTFGCNTQAKTKRPLALYRELTVNKIQNNPSKTKKLKDKKNKK